MLRTRFFLGLLPLLLLLVATGIYSMRESRRFAGTFSRDVVGNYRSVIASQQMRLALAEMGHALNPASRAEFEAGRSTFKRELMGQTLSSTGSPRAALVAALEQDFQHYSELCEPILAGSQGSRADLLTRETALKSVLDAIDALTLRDYAAAQQNAALAEQLTAKTERVLLTAMAVAVELSLLVGWWFAGSLLRPVKILTASAVALGEGQLDRDVPVLSRDELGQLARAFNTMGAKLREYRAAMQARVMRTQRTMEATLTSTPDPVFVVDRDGAHTVRNPAAESLAQLSEFKNGFPPALAEPLARVLASGEHDLPADYSRVITFRVGREDRHYLPRILAIGDKLTEFKGAAIILQDVTKLRLLDDAKTNLVGTVSHELKTPLTSLRMAVYLLLEQNIAGLTATQRDLLETARDDADRLLRILDNLLDLARLEAGASTLDRCEVAVASLLDEAAAEARGFIEAAGQKLDVQLAPALATARLTLDPGRIRHVFVNLLTNASKYSPRGGMITLSAAPAEENFIRFAVRDTGPGIPAQSIARVFDRFYRAPDQEKTGAGLGLAIAREIVVAHGGSIACTSEAGRGAEFYFLLPAAVSASSR